MGSSPISDTKLMQEVYNLEGFKILLIDDNTDVLELFSMILKLHNAEVVTASSSEQAVQRIKENDVFSIILCDISMPGEDGHSLIKKIRACNSGKVKDIPAIAVTAYNSPEDITKSISSGFQLHVVKPINPDDLVNSIYNLVKKKA